MKQENNNIVKKLTRRTLSANRSRNRTIIAAIVLTTLLLSSVFSVGMSYLKSVQAQQVRLMGTTAQVAVIYPTDEQVEKMKSLSYVKTVGLQHNVGALKITSGMKDMTVSLHWYDQTEWETFRKPAYANVVGSYPEQENEIMVPLWILQNMGIDDPQIGMEIPLEFYLGDERGVSQTKTFVLSGYCTDYSYIRTGNIGSILVSEEFAEQSGNTVEKDAAASVTYISSKNMDRYSEQLKQDLALTEDQQVKTVPMYESSGTDGSTTALAFAAVILFLMLTGYLLIYNVFYISVSRDIRFYGLLKTVGTAPRQLRKMVIGQALLLAAVGIPIGLALGAALSFAAVPMALNLANLETGVTVSFHPVIFIGAAFFALATTVLGAAKSARTDAKISPVEALRYTGTHVSGNRRRGTSGGSPFRMAWRNIFRDRKRAAIVLLSLFLGITTFMAVTTLVSSMDTDHYIASYVQNDFILENNTLDSIGVFALMASVTGEYGMDVLRPMSKFIATEYLAMATQMFLTYAILLKTMGKINIFRFISRAKRALITAFSTTSSAATVPVELDICESHLGVPKDIGGFSFPLGATVNQDGGAIDIPVCLIFTAQIYGMTFTPGQLITIIAMTLVMSIGAAGMPAGSTMFILMILAQFGLPTDAFALVLAIIVITDVALTTMNICGDMVCTTCVCRSEGVLNEKVWEKGYNPESAEE